MKIDWNGTVGYGLRANTQNHGLLYYFSYRRLITVIGRIERILRTRRGVPLQDRTIGKRLER